MTFDFIKNCADAIYKIHDDNAKLGGIDRFMTMTETAAIENIKLCIRTDTNKRHVRLDRLSFINDKLVHVVDKITENIIFYLNYWNDVDKCIKKDIVDIDNIIENENSKCEKINDKIFLKLDDSKRNTKEEINTYLKKQFNKSGNVYDIFTYLSIITLHYTLTSFDNELVNDGTKYKDIIMSAQLIFKGGASIGKFLFKENKEIYDRLDNNDKQYIYENFIKGGDNDTSIKFDEDLMNYYDFDWEKNKIVDDFMYKFNELLLIFMEIFEIENLINNEIAEVEDSSIKLYDNDDIGLKFKKYNAQSFTTTIIDKKKAMLEYHNDNKSFLINTISRPDFKNILDKRTHFYLSRIKACFKSRHGLTKYNATYTAECLDISAKIYYKESIKKEEDELTTIYKNREYSYFNKYKYYTAMHKLDLKIEE